MWLNLVVYGLITKLVLCCSCPVRRCRLCCNNKHFLLDLWKPNKLWFMPFFLTCGWWECRIRHQNKISLLRCHVFLPLWWCFLFVLQYSIACDRFHKQIWKSHRGNICVCVRGKTPDYAIWFRQILSTPHWVRKNLSSRNNYLKIHQHSGL